jgi:hypothetical protein
MQVNCSIIVRAIVLLSLMVNLTLVSSQIKSNAGSQAIQQAQGRAPGKSTRRYIDALVSAPILVTYSNDGAADMTVTEVGADQAGVVRNPLPEIRNIVHLREKAIPLLIEHLDDTRLTSARFDANNPRAVPVGHVCLDILTNIIDAPKILRKDCPDDGLGACIQRGYYFRPDAYILKGSSCQARPEVARVKQNWLRAYKKKYIKYKYPAWWQQRT